MERISVKCTRWSNNGSQDQLKYLKSAIESSLKLGESKDLLDR